jgi:hypothetical protein
MSHDTQSAGGTGYSGWDSVRLAVDSVFSTQLDRFEPNTVANVVDVLSACERLTKIPDGVKKGYLTTVVLWWDKSELEVFGDRVEVYRFHEKDTDIWYEEHTPGESFTPRFLAELSTLAP